MNNIGDEGIKAISEMIAHPTCSVVTLKLVVCKIIINFE